MALRSKRAQARTRRASSSGRCVVWRTLIRVLRHQHVPELPLRGAGPASCHAARTLAATAHRATLAVVLRLSRPFWVPAQLVASDTGPTIVGVTAENLPLYLYELFQAVIKVRCQPSSLAGPLLCLHLPSSTRGGPRSFAAAVACGALQLLGDNEAWLRRLPCG